MQFNIYEQRSYEERMRGSARKKWLQTIITAAETGAATMDGVYKAVFTCLYKVDFVTVTIVAVCSL